MAEVPNNAAAAHPRVEWKRMLNGSAVFYILPGIGCSLTGEMVPLVRYVCNPRQRRGVCFGGIVEAMPRAVKTGRNDREVSLAFFPETY
jgi:hypothetical protein